MADMIGSTRVEGSDRPWNMVGTSNRSGWSEGEEEKKKKKKSKSMPRLLPFLSRSLSCLRFRCARLLLLLVGGTYPPSMHEVQVQDRASPLVSSADASSSSLLLLVLSAGVNQLYLVARSRYLEIRPKALVCNLSALAWWLRTETSVLHAHYYQMLHVSACSCIQPR